MRASPIFVEELAIVGQVPMVFYLPQSDEKNDLTQLIERYGGLVSEMHECFTHQIQPLQQELQPNYFFAGDIYRAHWLADSVKEGKLLDKEDYFSFKNDIKNKKRLDFNQQHVQYTITEAIKIFEIAFANKGSA